MTFNDIWEEIVRCTGNVITTKENTKFTYVVNENSIFIPKANWKITKSELEGAVNKNVAKSVICKECGNRFIVCVCYNI